MKEISIIDTNKPKYAKFLVFNHRDMIKMKHQRANESKSGLNFIVEQIIHRESGECLEERDYFLDRQTTKKRFAQLILSHKF
jgi:hypothetical protein